MLKKFENLIQKNLLNNVYVTGFLSFEENGSAEFSAMLDFLYFEFGEQIIEFQSVEQNSKLRISMVDKVRYEFDKFEDDVVCKSNVSEIVLTKYDSEDNKVINACFYGLQINEKSLVCDALHVKLLNGQDIFIDPTFNFGINVGGLEQKKYWEEDYKERILPRVGSFPKKTYIIFN